MWALGDVLMATSMLSAIRSQEPDTHVAWIVDSSHAALLDNHPLIDEVITVDSGAWRRLLRRGNLAGWLSTAVRLNRELRARRFDVVINCHPEKSWTAWLSAAPKRIALFHRPSSFLQKTPYTISVQRPVGSSRHFIDDYRAAVAAAGYASDATSTSLGETDDERQFAEEFLVTAGIDNKGLIAVLAPFTSMENKSIDVDACASIARWLVSERGAGVVITGGPGDTAQGNEIVQRAGVDGVVFAEGTTLRQYIGLLRRSDVVITADSSALHLAGALAKPYVALFGPTDPTKLAPSAIPGAMPAALGRHVAPATTLGRVLTNPIRCAPCELPTCANPIYKACLRGIAQSEIQEAIDLALASIPVPTT